MASCEKQSDCTGQEVCSDGECVEHITPEPREVRRTFTTAKGEYVGQIKAESKMLDDFGKFLTAQLDEAAEERADQAESTSFWGTAGSIVGFGLGCMFGGPLGCVKGGTIGASAGSFIGRGTADLTDDAETYGLTEDEFAQLDPSQLKYMKGTYQDLVNDARNMQADLDKYDRNEWKQHVLGAIGDTWNAYKMASFGETLWEGGKELAKNIGGGEDIVPIAPTAEIPQTSGYSFSDPTTILDQPLSQAFPWQQNQDPFGKPE